MAIHTTLQCGGASSLLNRRSLLGGENTSNVETASLKQTAWPFKEENVGGYFVPGDLESKSRSTDTFFGDKSSGSFGNAIFTSVCNEFIRFSLWD